MRFARRFGSELLLQSGQFTLFYLLLQFSAQGWALFSNLGHSALLLFLVVQTLVLVAGGNRPVVRFWGSLIIPACYSLLEAREGLTFLGNSAHVGFWVFALATGGLQTLVLVSRRLVVKTAAEFTLTFLNVVSFLLLYFYFDTLSGTSDASELVITRIGNHVGTFLSDPTHLYVVWGGLVLALGLALGRSEILRLKERISTLFGQYVDAQFRDEILAAGTSRSRELEVAVLFSDLRDFTRSCEHASPQAVISMLNLYFSVWTEVVAKHGGVVDKFIGDAVMVLFGLRGEPQACSQAFSCAQEMLERWPEVRRRLEAEGLPTPAGLGIGLHFGPVILGDIGSTERRNYTVVGDTVNTASRLESACKEVGRPFVLSDTVYQRLPDTSRDQCRREGELELKGREVLLAAWSLAPAAPVHDTL